MPGDVGHMQSIGMAEGESIWKRMAAVITARRFDMRILMDAHDRRNYGFVDVPTFRRSLCYAFGNQWIQLAMTSAELDEIIAPYLTREPKGTGQPEAFVMWQKFANDLQALANTGRPSDDFLQRLTEVERKEKLKDELQARYQVTEYELKTAVYVIKDRLLSYNRSIIAAFKRLDMDDSGTLTRQEILDFFASAYLNDVLNERTISAILDFVDSDGDGNFNYSELTKVLECEDVLAMIPPADRVKVKSQAVIDAETPIGNRGATVADIKRAKALIKERLLTKHSTIRAALSYVDEDGSGILSRDEIKTMLSNFHLIKYVDYYTGQTRGELSEDVIDTLIDEVDGDDDRIDYQEFADILQKDNELVQRGGMC